jgi:hypothetical protein
MFTPRDSQAPLGEAPSSGTWSKPLRRLVSCLLLWHVAAMVAVALAGVPSSGLERIVARAFEPYFWPIALEHIHRYYSPAPPPTPVVTAELVYDDGRPPRSVRLPDRAIGPRIRYQRQLALANHLFSDHQRVREDPDAARSSLWGASYAEHLLAIDPDAARVTIRVQQHGVPDLVRLRDQAGRPVTIDPDDPAFYSVPEVVGEYSRSGTTFSGSN